ncbi:MAG: hypothetical protein LQ343_002968 [Gyalolechia ehrenbergii]|nr:MAG: hypothetical protein LQ343_002968 [Gyalolechia ehrenbergii]
MEVLHTAPSESQFTPLSIHQSQTPSSFYTGPPVLHHFSPSSTLCINSTDLQNAPAFSTLASHTKQQANGSTPAPADTSSEDEGHEVRIQNVDIWVTSEKFLLFSPALLTGVSIPYPSISLHAIQRSPQPSLLLQLLSNTGPQFDDHDPEGTISLTIVPKPGVPQTRTQESGEQDLAPSAPSERIENLHADPVDALFSALSACADLHPDAASDSDINIDDEAANNADQEPLYTQIDGLPPPMPGSGGWITAENIGEFFDEEGNFRGGGRLGEGAGVVRGREEEDEMGDVDGNGVDGDGEGEETKWRRTG